MDTFFVRCVIFLIHSKIFSKCAPHTHAILSNIHYLYNSLPSLNFDVQHGQSFPPVSSRTQMAKSHRTRRFGTSRQKKQTELFST